MIKISLMFIATIIIIFLIIYYIMLISLFIEKNLKVKTKKDFIKNFMPYYIWIKKVKNFYNDLED